MSGERDPKMDDLFDEEHRRVIAEAMKKKLREWGLDYRPKRLDIEMTLEYFRPKGN